MAITNTKGIKKKYQLTDKLLDSLKPSYNIAPTQTVPIITKPGNKFEVSNMQWGMRPAWAHAQHNFGWKTFNARAETVLDKRMWSTPFAKRRAVCPISGYYEWQGEGKEKQPYYISLEHEPVMSLAAIYESYTDKDSGEIIKTFSILTTTPSPELANIHDRMPVVLSKEAEADWFDPAAEVEYLQSLLVPYPGDHMLAYQVAKDVGNSRNNFPELVNMI